MTDYPTAGRAFHFRRDRFGSLSSAFVYSVALAMTAVTIPLLALEAGFHGFVVGLLVALSAVSQLATRPWLPRWMRRFSDRSIIAWAGVLMALSCVVLLLSHALWAFIVSQLLQGASRALFWTAGHTHVVRVSSKSMSGLGAVNLLGGLGALTGPVVAGAVGETSHSRALIVAAVASAVVVPLVFACARLEPFPILERDEGSRRRVRSGAWSNRGVALGGWYNGAAGAHRAAISSYVPVILQAAGHSPVAIGAVIAAGNVGALAGTTFAGRMHDRVPRAGAVMAVLATGLGLALLGPVAPWAPCAGIVLLASGLGAGALQTLGPGIAVESVKPNARGDAITASGTYRSVMMMASPAALSGLSLLMPLSGALAILGGAVCTISLARPPKAPEN